MKIKTCLKTWTTRQNSLVTMSEKRESAPSERERLRAWNCLIERPAIALFRAVISVLTAWYLLA